MARDSRNFRCCGRFLAFDLVAHGGNGRRVRTDEDDAGLGEGERKRFALGQKPIARMYGVGAARPAGGYDLVDVKVALGSRRRPDRDGSIGHFHMKRVLVGIGIDRDGLNPQPARRLDDATGDLAAVGDQNPLEHTVSATRPVGFAGNGGKCQFDIAPTSWSAGVPPPPP